MRQLIIFISETARTMGFDFSTHREQDRKHRSNVIVWSIEIKHNTHHTSSVWWKQRRHTKTFINNSLFFFLLTSTESKIGDTGATSLSESLKSNTTLTKLNLRSRDEGKNTQKTSINNSSFSIQFTTTACYIRDTGAASLSEALESNTTLTALDLGRENRRNKCKWNA